MATAAGWYRSVLFAALAAFGCGDEVKVELVTPTVDFGETDCGTTPIPRVMTVSNDSSEAFHFTAELTAGADSRYTLVPPTGVVLPHSQATVMVFSKPIPAESAVTPNLYGETVIVTTDREDDKPHEVAITQTAHGAVLEVSSSAVNFATEILLGSSSEVPFTIRNTGNAPANVTVEGETPSVTFVASDSVIAAGAELQGTLTFTPGHNVAHREELSIRTSGPTCGTSKPVVTGFGSARGLAAYALPGSTRARPRSGGSALCVRTTTGVVACAGANDNGMRGATDEYIQKYLPLFQGKGGGGGAGGGFELLDRLNLVQTETGFLTDVVELVGGVGFYCARRQAGDVWCWGDYRGLGNRFDGPVGRSNPFAVKVADAGVVGLAAGYLHRCQIVGSNRAFSCTSSRGGNNSVSHTTWTLSGVTSAVVNGGGGYAVTGGTVMSFGLNRNGERGNGDDEHDPPSAVTGLTGITQVATGGRGVNRNTRFACARKDDGTAWCWGDNAHGQLGNGTRDGRSNHQGRQTPAQVIDTDDAPLAGVTAVTAGRVHACALIGGSVSCWGRPPRAQVGAAAGTPNATPTDPPLTNAVAVEAGGTHATCAVLSTGALHCWGEFGNSSYLGPEALPAFDP